MSLTNRILLAMVAGILVGSGLNLALHSSLPEGLRNGLDIYLVGGLFDVIGRIFVASLKLLVVPLVLVSLICGSSSLGDSARMGPIAVKTLGFYLATTAIAVTSALLVAVIAPPQSASADEAPAPAAAAQVNINKADAQTLAAGLKGIGQARAQEIVRYRETFGPCASAEELMEVKGIGQSTLNRNRAVITLE